MANIVWLIAGFVLALIIVSVCYFVPVPFIWHPITEFLPEWFNSYWKLVGIVTPFTSLWFYGQRAS